MTATTATANGSTSAATAPDRPRDGLPKLRCQETKTLIEMVSEAIYQTGNVTSQMHKLIYTSKDGQFDPERLYHMTVEALACWQMADHYLRLFKDNADDYGTSPDSPF